MVAADPGGGQRLHALAGDTGGVPLDPPARREGLRDHGRESRIPAVEQGPPGDLADRAHAVQMHTMPRLVPTYATRPRAMATFASSTSPE